MRLVPINEKIETSNNGDTIRFVGSGFDDDDFDDVVDLIDRLFDMLINNSRFRAKFKSNSERGDLRVVRNRFDKCIRDIKDNQQQSQ